MLPTYVYLLLAAALLAVAVPLSLTATGRRRLFSALPGAVFFLLLLGTGEVAYRVGMTNAGPGGAGADQTYTCSMHPQVRQPGPGLCPICHMELVPLTAAGTDQGGGITIDPVVVQNMGVRVLEVGTGTLHRTIRAFGALRTAEDRQYDVALRVPGFVERLHADTEGMKIARGAPLLELYAPELIVAQEELIGARRSGDEGLLQAARLKLLLWDVPEQEVDRLQQLDRAERTVTFRSPVQGVLLRRDVVEGAPAPQDRVLLRIADLSVLWLDAQVTEQQLAAVHLGQPTTATLPALPGRELAGEVVFVAPVLDERSRTATVRVEVANTDGALRPGMFARLFLRATLAEDAVLVPLEAALDTGVRQLAWVAVGKGRFEERALRLGPSGDDGLVQVLDGLQPGDQVVTSGQFLIDAESRLREGGRKLDDEGLMPGGDLPPPKGLELSAVTQQQTDALLVAYLAVQRDLAADRYEPAAFRALRQAVVPLTAAAEPELQPLAAALAEAVPSDPPPDIVMARVRFKAVSAAAERLFEQARPSASLGEGLFVQHCPMAEADWLQVTPAVRNPYYGSSMLECGAVRRELPLAKEGGK